MEIEIEVISRETVRPATQNPKSQSKYNLSFLDQMAPPVFMPLIYFYGPDNNIKNSEKLSTLKKTLSQALSIFYPLSGRLVNDSYVDCSDQGSPFVEAKADCKLSRVITDPNPENMDKFLPYKVNESRDVGMAVQVTFFECGGVALGLVVSHKVADALSFFLFANTWAEIAKYGPDHDLVQPIFGMSSIFPPRELSGFKPNTGMQKKELLDTKIFTFKSSKISTLKDRYSGPTTDHRPTRVEALSAFLWTRFAATIETKPDPNKIYLVLHAINLRSRLEPALSDHHFGNISRLAIALPEVRDDGQRLDDGYELLEKLRGAIRAVDADYVAKLKRGDNHLSYMKEMMTRTIKGEIVTLNFTSLCRFPLYEADFGWGKPAWVGSAGFGYKNLVTFIDKADGDGIEAWISMRKEDMEKFESDLELREFTAQDN